MDPQIYADTGHRGAQERWSSKNLAAEEAEEEEGGAGLRTGHPQYNSGSPHPPDKDPLKSPAFPPSVTHEEYISARSQQQGGVSNTGNRHTLERQGSYQSSWEKAAQQVTKHPRGESAQQQTPSSYHPSPSSATSTSSQPFIHRAPHEELSRYYQDQNSRPPSQQSLEPSTSTAPAYIGFLPKQTGTQSGCLGYAHSSLNGSTASSTTSSQQTLERICAAESDRITRPRRRCLPAIQSKRPARSNITVQRASAVQ